jgi:hypothetical protein
MKPWMQEDQIKLVERILLSFGNRPVNILEWGSGGSTVYFTRFLEENGINYRWHSVEHQVEWYNEIKIKLNSNTTQIHLKSIDPDNPASINFDHYVRWPRILTEFVEKQNPFDFILVDGRARARCLVEAKFLVKPDGIIMLHDAEREKYHYVFPLFENGKLIESEVKPHAVWITGNYQKLFEKCK